MKPETTAFLRKSREFLVKAQDLLDAHRWPDEAGRAAYLAGLHAAKALIFEITGEMTRSHKRVQKEFSRLTKDNRRFDTELRAFLGRTYNLKAIADYDTGPGSRVSVKSAREAIQTAAQLLECVTDAVPPNGFESK